MDAGVFELKIQLFLVGKQCQFQCGRYESLVESLQSNFHTSLKVWLKVCSQTFIPPWKFALKVSGPLESFNWNFQPCILATIVIQIRLKVSLKLSLQTFKGVWKFDWNFQCKLSRGVWKFDCKLSTKLSGGYESLTANFQLKFQGVCKFDCKFSIKVSRGTQVWLQMFNQTFNAIQKIIKNVQICWLLLLETKAIHQDLYKIFLITMIKCFVFLVEIK